MKRFMKWKMITSLVVGIVLLAVGWAVKANAASIPKCFGKPATYVGTSGVDDIMVGYDNNVIMTMGGNDIVHVDPDSDTQTFICMGDGNDTVVGPVWNVNGGSGKDLATVYACPWANSSLLSNAAILSFETVTVENCTSDTP